MDIGQCFKILELTQDASIEEAAQAYKDLVAVWHPDRFPNNPRLREKAEERLKLLNQAYEKVVVFIKWKQDIHHAGAASLSGDPKSQNDFSPKKKKNTAPEKKNPPYRRKKAERSPTAIRPGIRFFARLIDYFVFACVLWFFGAGDILPQNWYGAVINPVILTALWIIPESFFLYLDGTTPGKWVFGIKLVDLFQLKPTFLGALRRSLSVWCNGMGMGVPFIAPFTCLISLHKLKKKGKTAWDQDLGFSVHHKNVSRFRHGLALIVLLFLFLFIFVDPKIMVKAWQHVVQLKPEDPENQLQLGILYAKIGQHQAAIDAFQQAIRIKQDYAKAHYHLGISYLETKGYEAALKPLKTAVKLKPDNDDAHLGLGMCYEKLHMLDNAIHAYLQAIRINDNSTRAYYRLGRSYFESQRYQEALAPLKRSISLDARDAQKHFYLGRCYFRINHMQDAIKSFQQAIKIDFDHEKAHYQIGLCHFELGNFQEAINPFKTATSLNPNNAKAFYGLGICYAKLRFQEKAVVSLKTAIRLRPDYAKAHHILGIVYLSMGKKTAAVTQYETLKNMNPSLAKELLAYIEHMPTSTKETERENTPP